MTIAKLQARMRALEKAHGRANNLDFLATTRGQMTEELAEHRREAREIEREALLHEIADWTDDCAREEARERQEKRRTRWHGFTYAAMRALPYYRGLDLTKGEKAVLTALGAASAGKTRFEVAHDWIVAKAGVSRATVKRTIRRLEDAGLLGRQERRIRGKAMNLWNRYTLKCDKLAAWAVALFSIQGVRTDLHPPRGDSPSATGEQDQAELELGADAGATPCRKKALRHDGGGREGGERQGRRSQTHRLEVGDDFAAVARAAMRELGHDLDDALPPDAVADAVEALKDELQPDYKPFFWQRAVWSHGRATALMAFLETRLVRDMRRGETSDNRPWNEREPIRDANRYLSGILKVSPALCRPDITVVGKLDRGGLYTLPTAWVDRARAHAAARAGLHRHASSAG